MLSPIVPSCLHTGKSKSHQRRVNSRRWDKAARWIQDRVSPQALKTYLVIQRLTSGQPRRLSKRLLASRRGVSTKTIYNHTSELIAAKVMRAVYSKVAYNRNAPNLYIFLDIDGNDMERNCTEKPLQTLKPNTPRAVRVENHPPAMRKLYERNGDLLRRLRLREKRDAYRLQRAQDRTRRAMEASLGMYAGPKLPEPTEAEIQAFWERDAKRKAEHQRRFTK